MPRHHPLLRIPPEFLADLGGRFREFLRFRAERDHSHFEPKQGSKEFPEVGRVMTVPAGIDKGDSLCGFGHRRENLFQKNWRSAIKKFRS